MVALRSSAGGLCAHRGTFGQFWLWAAARIRDQTLTEGRLSADRYKIVSLPKTRRAVDRQKRITGIRRRQRGEALRLRRRNCADSSRAARHRRKVCGEQGTTAAVVLAKVALAAAAIAAVWWCQTPDSREAFKREVGVVLAGLVLQAALRG